MSGPIALTLAAGPLMSSVLARVVGATAAQAGLDLDRLDDAKLAAEAIADDACRRVDDGRVVVEAVVRPGVLCLTFGPFPPGAVHEMRARPALPGAGPLVDGLADEVSVEGGVDGERLVLRFGGTV